MKTHFYYESYLARIRRYILIFLTATIFLLESAQDLSSKENIFIVEDIKIEGFFDTNFSREKFIDEAFKKSFLKLLSQILVSEDFSKLKNLSLKEIKNLIYSFKILDEKFKDQRYSAIFQVIYNDQKVKELLSKKNISYFKPKNATVIFFPIFIHDNEVKIFKENYFYNNWLKEDFKDETIKYILPLEDLDEILIINKAKNQIENLDFKKISNQYNTSNYVVAIMSYQSSAIKVYLKTNLELKKHNENLSYMIQNLKDESRLNYIIEDLKLKIFDIWKKVNLINIPLPLNIYIKFEYKQLEDLHNLEKILNKIYIINSHSLEKFDNKNSFFKINYYGDPKKLKEEFSRFNHTLKDDNGRWVLKTND